MPTYIVGTCPFCERENVNLYIATGYDPEEGPIAMYICMQCQEDLRKLRSYYNEDKKAGV